MCKLNLKDSYIHCQGISTGGGGVAWSSQKQIIHINVLDLMAVKLAILTFTKNKRVNSIHPQVDNMTAISFKNGGTRNETLIIIAKEILDYLLSHKIMITAEYSAILCISQHYGLKRVETKPVNISQNMPKGGHTRYGSFRITTVESSASVYGMEIGPKKQSNRCSTATLVSSIPIICISPVFINREGPVKSTKGGSENNYCDPIMEKSVMVHQSVAVICTLPNFTSLHT